MFSFVDSAHVYLSKGEFGKTQRILETMREQNGCHNVSIDFARGHGGLAAGATSMWESVCKMFSGQFFGITCVMCMLTFTLNLSYYGVGYSMPIVLQGVDLHLSPASVLLVIPVVEVAGYLSSTLLSNWFGRRAFIMGFLSAGITVFMCMAYGLFRLQDTPRDSTGQILVLAACLLFKFILAHGWTVVYLYLTEVYPTTCRGSAVGFCIALGRFGSISTPFIFEHLYLLTGQHIAYFFVACGLMVVDAIASFWILPETKGKKLEVFADEATPLKKWLSQWSVSLS